MKYLFLTLLIPFMVHSDTYTRIEPPKEETGEIEAILEKLALCESGGDLMAYNPNDPVTPSYGKFQFKLETFNHFAKYYRLPHTDIFDEHQQTALAKAMIQDGRGKTHWKNCWTKLGL